MSCDCKKYMEGGCIVCQTKHLEPLIESKPNETAMTKDEIVEWVFDAHILGAVHVTSDSILEIVEKAWEQGAAEQREKYDYAISQFLLSWADVKPFIEAMCVMEANRGRPYKGPILRIDLLKEAIANAESKLTEGKIRTQTSDEGTESGTEQSEYPVESAFDPDNYCAEHEALGCPKCNY